MKLDITVSPSEFRQQLSELLAGDSDIADQELDGLLKFARHGWNLKKARTQPRERFFSELLIKSANRIQRYNWPVTIESVANGLLELEYDGDCYRIIEGIYFDEEKDAVCVIWNDPKSGKRKATPYSAIAKVLKRAGIKYESYLNEGCDEGLYRISDELHIDL